MAIKKLQLDLLHCHGIGALSSEISFKNSRAASIYAPNGTMKTSLAKTFADLANDVQSTDNLFPDRASRRSITDQSGIEIAPDQVVVIVSYDEAMAPTEQTSTLLVDTKLKAEYELLEGGVKEAEKLLCSALKKTAVTKKDVAQEISQTFTSDADRFFRALARIEEEIAEDDLAFAAVPYDVIFNDKVLALLQDDSFGPLLEDYISKLNELLDESAFFSREQFSFYNAEVIFKALQAQNFFEARHSLNLKAETETREVLTQEEFKNLIDSEREKISEDESLRKAFSAIESSLNRNAETRAFRDFISANRQYLPELQKIGRFRESVWKSYIKQHEELYQSFLRVSRSAEGRKKEIESAASEQRGQWESVIEIFNRRFFVPFTLTIKNRASVVLGRDPIAKLGFTFRHGDEEVEVDRGDLLEVLSTGEKKALYILNVLFEVERRKSAETETIFVVDDIADSFDYKNKYAIVQYLKDISDFKNFRLLMLTHNFDFYRTLESRFVPYGQCQMVERKGAELHLIQAAGIKNPFVKDFKPGFFADASKRAAAIPFMRNLIEYMRGVDDEDYMRLTSILHWKPGQAEVRQKELDQIFRRMFGGAGEWSDPDQLVLDMIVADVKNIIDSEVSLDIASKINFSIAIRVLAEKYLFGRLEGAVEPTSITSNQAAVLLAHYKAQFPDDQEVLRIVDNVVLMTPENIHVNSFMYEPILDMSDLHLRKLFVDVCSLDDGLA